MSVTDRPTTRPLSQLAPHQVASMTPPKNHPHRWQLSRAGLTNVWFYYDTTFEFSGGRAILRGTNGSGKSRALEMLLPFLLDADRRRMDATGSGKVQLAELMAAGDEGQANRVGYLWLELARTPEDDEAPTEALDPRSPQDPAGPREYLTVGAFIRFSRSTSEAKVHYFTTPLRVGHALHLMSESREPLTRDKLTELVGVDRITDSRDAHRDRIRSVVYGLTGDAGKERFDGLLQLLHTLRSPDVGNRIEEGRLPQLLSEALPPLGEGAITSAGDKLDGLSATRAAQQALTAAHAHLQTFLRVYRRYAAGVLRDAAHGATGAAGHLDNTTAAAAERRREEAELNDKLTTLTAHVETLAGTETELTGTIEGLKASAAYRSVQELGELEASARFLEGAAKTALAAAATARQTETRAAARATGLAQTATESALADARSLTQARDLLRDAGCHPELPQTVAVTAVTDAHRSDPVRVAVDADPTPTARPTTATLRVTPLDLPAAAGTLDAAGTATEARRRSAEQRLAEARRLQQRERDVSHQEATAAATDKQAAREQEEAQEQAEARDTTAGALAQAWQSWRQDPATLEALRPLTDDTTDAVAEADAPLDPVVVLLGDAAAAAHDEALLDRLDAVAVATAEPVSRQITLAQDALDRADQDAAQQRKTLLQEQRQLEAAIDPAPASPAWVTAPGTRTGTGPAAGPATGPALWQVVDFTADVSPADRAGLEGALLASGLLTATVSADADAYAADGQLLVRGHGSTAAEPLSRLLTVDPTAANADAIRAVLDRVGLACPGDNPTDSPLPAGAPPTTAAPTWVSVDGSWAHGPLTGRHVPATARHIGAAARAASRAVRLTEIAAEVADLDAGTADRAQDRLTLAARRAQLDAAIARAPRTRALRAQTVEATVAQKNADRTRTRAQEQDRAARAARKALDGDVAGHRDLCAAADLLPGIDPLNKTVAACAEARRACGSLAGALRQLHRQVLAHAAAVTETGTDAESRAEAETTAEAQWQAWHSHATSLAALRSAVGADAETVLAKIAAAQGMLTKTSTELRAEREARPLLDTGLGIAREHTRQAVAAVSAADTALHDALAVLRTRLGLPGIAAAAYGHLEPAAPPDQPQPGQQPGEAVEAGIPAAAVQVRSGSLPVAATVTAATVRAAADAVTADLPALAEKDRVGDGALMRARESLVVSLTGTFDVSADQHDDVWLFELTDVEGRRDVAAAAADLARQSEEGRRALTEQERRVFTDFVLGGVGAELHDRLKHAKALIDAMNQSLSSIETSHRIGVRLDWDLAEGADADVSRIRDLVSTAPDLRTADAAEELTTLLKSRVEAGFELDPTSGYTTHLRAALDYRAWHAVTVTLIGPAEKQRRKLTRGSKLSQGETRFVSYVTLFAAMDAYVSGLPSHGRALRLMLLDDAFAKVDERTIAELMGLLVRLDMDFVMTGHALWGTYPTVPALDCYEIRRREGGPAVATHVHWDGRSRHLRAAQ